MKKAFLFGLLAASVLAAGCETPQTNTSADKSEADVITGSRIPRKGGGSEAVGTMGAEDYKRSGGTGMKGN